MNGLHYWLLERLNMATNSLILPGIYESPLESGTICDCFDLLNLVDMVLYQVLNVGHKILVAATLSFGILETEADNCLVKKNNNNILRVSGCEEAQSMHEWKCQDRHQLFEPC